MAGENNDVNYGHTDRRSVHNIDSIFSVSVSDGPYASTPILHNTSILCVNTSIKHRPNLSGITVFSIPVWMPYVRTVRLAVLISIEPRQRRDLQQITCNQQTLDALHPQPNRF